MRSFTLPKIYVLIFAQSNLFACCLQSLSPVSKFSELRTRSINFLLKSGRSVDDHSRIYESSDKRQESVAVFTSDFDDNNLKRRSFLRHIFGLFSMPLFCRLPAHARGLVKFPIKEGVLLNNYHFMRSGESLLEEEGVWSTNPLFL